MSLPFSRAIATAVAATLTALSFAAHAGDVQVAVASNFAAPMQKLGAMFEQDTGHKAVLSFGATGRLYTQLKGGAPYEVLLAADDESPQKLIEDGFAVKGTSFLYAKGRLVLWSPKAGFVDNAGGVLRGGRFEKLAVADPNYAPYGLAALETLKTLRIAQVAEPKLVRSESVAQAYESIVKADAQLGFVALSQVMLDGKVTQGSIWMIPGGFYTPIMQNAVLLTKGKDNPAATAFLEFLRGEKARAVIRGYGYAF